MTAREPQHKPLAGLDPKALYWEPKNPGRIACSACCGMSVDTHDIVTPADVKALSEMDPGHEVECEDCGMKIGGDR